MSAGAPLRPSPSSWNSPAATQFMSSVSREIARDVAVSGPPAPLIDLLEQQERPGCEPAKHVEDRVVGLSRVRCSTSPH